MAAMKRPHLVGVSWCMPPGQFPRSIQVARLMKGLRHHGWDSTIVTPHIEQVPGAPIDADLARIYRDYYELETVDISPGRELPGHVKLITGEETDDQRWARCAADAVKRVVRARSSRALVTFAQPWRDHLVGLELAAWPGRPPWIAHFSDPWSDSLYYSDLSAEELEQARSSERKVIDAADLVVFTNHYAADLVMAKYPASHRNKVRVLPHIADPDVVVDAERLRAASSSGSPRPMRIAHVGNLFIGRRTADALLEALARVRRNRSGRAFEVVFVGEGSGLEDARRKAAALGLADVVSFKLWQTHVQSMAAMCDSHVLALIDAPAATNVFFASKLVDYLAADRPILALTPATGPSADLARELGYPVVDPQDAGGIAAAIDALLQRHHEGTLASSSLTATITERLGCRQVAAAFAAILDEVDGHAWTYPARIARNLWRRVPAPIRHRAYMSVMRLVEILVAERRPLVRSPRFPHLARYAWWVARFVRRVTGLAKQALRRIGRLLTLKNHRANARAYWPDATGVELFGAGIVFASLRFHSFLLRQVWANAHRWRRLRPARRPVSPATILHVTSSFDLGGTQTQIKNLCTASSGRFHHDAIEVFPELNYLYRRGERIDPSRYLVGGTVRRAIGRFITTMSTRSPQLIQTMKLVQDFNAAKPDVVVGWGHEMCATTFVAAAIARVPYIVFCIRTFNPAYAWTTPEMGKLLRIAHARMTPYVDAVVTNSTQLKDDHARWLGIASDSIIACPNGITIATLTPGAAAERRLAVRTAVGADDETAVVLNVGRFSAEKGQQSIVEANAQLMRDQRTRPVLWLLCGDGPTLAPIKADAEARGMTNIRFLGRTDLVQDYLCAADVFVMPSDFEGMPNAMMEAMAYGLPCVSTNRSGALDVARDGIEALYYEPRDAAQLARHLRTLLDNPIEAQAMGIRARNRMQEFSVRRFADGFDRILSQVVRGTAAAPTLKPDGQTSSASTS